MFLQVTAVPPDVEIQRQLTSMHISEWLREDIFQFRWWCLIVFLAVAVFVWWKLLDKSRLPEIVLYTALAVISVMAIVEYGEELTLWDYPTDILPVFPPLTTVNLIILPLIYSLIYQNFKTLRSFVKAALITTGIMCFVLEPLLVWGEFYKLLKWKFYFSFPVYFTTAIVIRSIILKVKAINKKYKNI